MNLPLRNSLTVDELLSPERNNFDLIRLILAILVIYGHSFAVTPGPGQGKEWVHAITGFYGGDIAIKGFFFISGLLVGASLLRVVSPTRYLVARFFRIIPALFVVATVSALLIGPAYSSLDWQEYFSNPATWEYIARTVTLQYWGKDLGLPGVFANNPYPNSINAPLWSICAEVFCYLMLLALFLISRLSKSFAVVAFALIVIDSILPAKMLFTWLPQSSTDFSILPFCFATGALLAVFRKECVLGIPTLIGCMLAIWLFSGTPLAHLLRYGALFLILLLIAINPITLRLKLQRDISYGVYLWGWPVQQMYAAMFPNTNHLMAFVACGLLAVILAYFSSRFIEESAINFGRRLGVRLDPAKRGERLVPAGS